MGVTTSERRKMQALESLESNVRLYSRTFPASFSQARGSIMLTEEGRKVIDFLSGAGALNYGHNNHRIKAAIVDYLAGLTWPRRQVSNSWRRSALPYSGNPTCDISSNSRVQQVRTLLKRLYSCRAKSQVART